METWTLEVGAFAKAIGYSLDAANATLKPLVGDPSDAALAILKNAADVPDSALRDAFADPKPPVGVFNRAVRELRGMPSAPPVVAAPVVAAPIVTLGLGALPALPDDESFVAQLVTGGKAKMPALDAVAAVRASFANSMGLYGILDRIADGMEAHALSIDEPVPEIFEEIDVARARRRYPEELRAAGVTTRLVTKERKAELFRRMGAAWSELREFQGALDGWMRSWTEKAAGPAGMNAMFARMAGGPAGIGPTLSLPDTGLVRDSASGVIDAFNKAFAGNGIQVARGLAFEAAEENKYLSRNDLHVHFGCASRDEMLKKLGVAVGANVDRQERAAAQYVWCVMKSGEISDPEFPGFIERLCELGRVVPWDALTARTAPESRTIPRR